MKLAYSPPTLTLIFEDKILQQEVNTETVKLFIENEFTYEEALAILFPELAKEKEKEKELLKIETDDRFYFKDYALYRKGIDLSIPKYLAEDIAICIDSKETARKNLDDVNYAYWDNVLNKLDNFWKWTSLIRSASSRESFYAYAVANKMIITNEGMCIAFRRAQSLVDPSLREFAIATYTKRAKNKKFTNVNVYQDTDGDYSIQKSNSPNDIEFRFVGNLRDLYQKSNTFQSRTSGSNGHLFYTIGEETREDINNVDWSDAECSRGIHISNGGYNFKGYGDTPLAVLFNPMDVVYCPYSDHSKMRVMAITPIAVLEDDCQFTFTDKYQKYVSELVSDSVNYLNTLLNNANFEDITINKVLSNDQAVNILNVIVDDNKDLIKKRNVRL